MTCFPVQDVKPTICRNCRKSTIGITHCFRNGYKFLPKPFVTFLVKKIATLLFFGEGNVASFRNFVYNLNWF